MIELLNIVLGAGLILGFLKAAHEILCDRRAEKVRSDRDLLWLQMVREVEFIVVDMQVQRWPNGLPWGKQRLINDGDRDNPMNAPIATQNALEEILKHDKERIND